MCIRDRYRYRIHVCDTGIAYRYARVNIVLDRAIANGGSVFRLSVTVVIHVYTVQDIETHFALHERAMFLVS